MIPRDFPPADHWDTINHEIEAWYWSRRRTLVPIVQYVGELAEAVANEPDLICRAIGGEWDFQPVPTINGTINSVAYLPPRHMALLAVCRKCLAEYEWSIRVNCLNEGNVIITAARGETTLTNQAGE